MEVSDLHPWEVSYKEAVRIQAKLRDKVNLQTIDKKIEYIAGLDVSYEKKSNKMWAGVVVLGFASLNRAEERLSQREVSFPYIPGLLSFREIPVLLDALRKVEIEPDIIFCDGQGIAHPRGLGLASHLGVLLQKPTIGCAKSRLVGAHNEVGESKGNWAYLIYQNRIVGAVVRTKSNVKPMYVSQGYGVAFDDCIKFVLETCSDYRIPEPTRQAHFLVNTVRARILSGRI